MSVHKNVLLLVETRDKEYISWKEALGDKYLVIGFKDWNEAFTWLKSVDYQVDIIATDFIYPHKVVLNALARVRERFSRTQLPFIIYTSVKSDKYMQEADRLGVNDFYQTPLNFYEIKTRFDTLIKLKKELKRSKIKNINAAIKPRFIKRAFDIISSGMALLLLSPIFLAVMAAIRLDSKGPIFYTSKRVGAGYKVFDLYKFRTMSIHADKQIDKFKHLNAYQDNNLPSENIKSCDECAIKNGNYCAPLLFQDGELMCEKAHQLKKENKQDTFIKLKNDPRITKLGHFLRNTSLDELPQLINIFKGDMSLVGNRPLPLYEAEKLTTDESLQRFLAPAGLTGLWQVTKRGKADMSVEERIALDNQYAQNQSLMMDIKIILKTFPALFQHDNV